MLLHEKVAYLADLSTLLAYHEDLGATTPNQWIAKEFQVINAEVMEELKDKHDETRSRNKLNDHEAGAGPEQDRSRRGIADRDDVVV